MNAVILEKLASFSLDDYRPIYSRALDLGEPLRPRAGNLVKVVIGIRRCGKSYRLFREMDRLLAMGVPKERICYFNFEDERLAPVTPSAGDEVLEAFFGANPSAHSEGAYLFFDEIQAMSDWSAWLRRVVDSHRATIYVSGSSSKLLSSEVSTEFRGRALEYELYPYSFAEYVQVMNPEHAGAVSPAEDAGDGMGSRSHIPEATRVARQNLLTRYLARGGFPDAQQLPLERAIALLQSYEERVVLKDIVERHSVTRPRVAVRFAQRVLASNGQLLSIRQSVRALKAAGIGTSQEVLGDLLDYLEESFLAFRVRRYDRSLAEGANDQPKVYAIDPGLAQACSGARAQSASQPLENVVYLELLRRTPGIRENRVSYLKTRHGHEVDFVAGDALLGVPDALYQVTWEMDDAKTREREVRSLVDALEEAHARSAGGKYRSLPEATIIVGQITPRGLNEMRAYLREVGGVAERINVRPAVEWLIEG